MKIFIDCKKKFLRKLFFICLGFIVAFSPQIVFGVEANTEKEAHFGLSLAFLGILLLFGKIFNIIEKFKQPIVLGELLAGVVLGNLVYLGVPFFENIRHNEIIHFLAELGVVILLFQIGLESNIRDMKKVGKEAFFVAIIGVVTPFIFGAFLAGPLILPNQNPHTYIFLGAALTATSVGITARVFKDIGKMQTREARLVLGAAVIDDILGLIILAVVTALVKEGNVSPYSISTIVAKAIAFLAISIILGEFLARRIGNFLSKINSGVGMKFTILLAFCLLYAFLAEQIGLAPIIGAFAAGLVLDPVQFRSFEYSHAIKDIESFANSANENVKKKLTDYIEHHKHKHIEDIIEPLSFFVVPLFFIYTGFTVDLKTFLDPNVLFMGVAITFVAFISKTISGIVAGKYVDRLLVGLSMVPRGEVGIIFATTGRTLGVLDDKIFSVIVVVVILTTIIAPSMILQRLKSSPSLAQ
ncbi:MAG: cation:proton antiporter [Patescibacteria group bacterium]|nr:cation:proton antiporter [Patescibacteria group bacterium]